MSLAVIAGSGLGGLERIVDVERAVSFDEIPGVGAAKIAGHAGRILRGGIDGRACQLVLGRRHFYEGDVRPIHRLIEYLHHEGATTLLVTSAAGSLRPWLHPGDLVVIRDIIDLQNRDLRALAGPDIAHPGTTSRYARRRGPRAMPPARALGAVHVDDRATLLFERAATTAKVAWQRGTMFCTSGPLYETMADVGMLQFAGGDVATMSGAPEVTRANELGLPAVAVAVVTNPCTGINAAVPSHGEVLEASARAAVGLASVIRQFVTNI